MKHSTPVREENKREEEQGGSLYRICQQIPDGRKKRGRRYALADVLMIIIVAKLAGMQSLLAISEWAKDQETMLRAYLQVKWKRMPCANTYANVLANLESQQVNEQVAAWLVRQWKHQSCTDESDQMKKNKSEEHMHVAIDGKALKGTGTHTYGGERPQQHLLHVYEVNTGIVLQQIPIERKENEVSALKHRLTEVLCKGRVLTADAAQSYHAFPQLVKQAGGEAIVMIKGNTPQTQEDVTLFFEDAQADKSTWQSAQVVNKEHGRLETRTITVSPDLNEFFFPEWGEIGQVFQLKRERTIKDRTSREVVYGLTTLTCHQCPPARLLSYLRDHWKIENRLHWCRDAILREDDCRVRRIPTVNMLAVLHNLILSLMRLRRVSGISRQMRRFASHPHEAFAWLL